MMAQALAGPVTYTEALSRGGALLAETRVLALTWRPDESVEDLIERARTQDLLGKSTARTVKDYVRVFARRFLIPSDQPARHLQRLAGALVPLQVFDDLAIYYLTQKDALLHDAAVLLYWPMAREGRTAVALDDVRQFLADAERDGRIAKPWSAAVKRDMPARVLNALAEFGLLGPLRNGRREILSYHPADGTLVYLAYLLHADGITDGSLADQPAWSLFGLEPSDVWNRLELLATAGWFIVQRAGQVVRVTWRYAHVEEAIDALVGG